MSSGIVGVCHVTKCTFFSIIWRDNLTPMNLFSQNVDSNADDPASSVPFTLEHVLPELLPYALKWKLLGEALSLDEDLLDEIFTNNETDEDCLHNMLEMYMARSGFIHSWDEIQAALKKLPMENSQEGESPCK